MTGEIVVTGFVGEGGGVLFLAFPNGEVEELGAPETPAGVAAVALCELSHYYEIPVNESEWERLLALEKVERRSKGRRR